MTDDFVPKRVVSRAEAELKGSVWICSSISSYTDDVRTSCVDCSCPIVHRPHAFKNSIKLCMPCARIRYGLEKTKYEDIAISEEVLRDLIERRKAQ